MGALEAGAGPVLDVEVDVAPGPGPAGAELVGTSSAMSAKIPTVSEQPMSLARASWITVVLVCAVAAVLLSVSGYSGYAITVAAVGLAAAVNLLPNP
jgi:hypothetical protein